MQNERVRPVDQESVSNPKVTVLSVVNKRNDQWSLLLVEVGLNKDREAFEKLFRHFAPLLKGFAQASRHEGWFPAIGEELVQEVMIKVWQKASGFDPSKASATTWIYTVARNCRIDMLRRKSNTQHLPIENEDLWQEPDEETPMSVLRQRRNEEKIKSCLDQLPREQDAILRKVYLEGKSHTEASEELNLPLGTVKSRVRLALQKLQVLVTPDYQEEIGNE